MAVKSETKRAEKEKGMTFWQSLVYNRGSSQRDENGKTNETGEQKMKAYDYVVVGSGLYGAVFAGKR